MNEVSKVALVDHQNETEPDSIGDASEDASHKVTNPLYAVTGSTTSGKDISFQLSNPTPALTNYYGYEIVTPCDQNTRIKARLSDRNSLSELP